MAEVLGVLWQDEHNTAELLDDGYIKHTIGIKPLNYKDELELWHPINSAWQANADGAWPNIVSTAPIRTKASGTGMRRIYPVPGDDTKYVEIGRPHVLISGSWSPLSMGSATRTANRISWSTTDFDMVIAHGGHFVKLWIDLKTATARSRSRVVFPVGIQGLTRSGSDILNNGVVVMHIDPPHVEDATNPDDKRDIDFDFRSVTISGSATPVLHMQLPDLTGMVLPRIDPTLTLQPAAAAGEDAEMRSSTPTTGYGTNASMRIGEAASAASISRAWIRFDLSSLPSIASISSATLSLYATADDSSNTRTIRVYRLLKSPVEGGIRWDRYSVGNNWTTAGGFDPADCEQTDIGSLSLGAAETLNVFKDIPLTPTTKAALENGNGWLLKVDTENADQYTYATSDDATAANRPKLVIIYTLAQSGSGSITPTGTVTRVVSKLTSGTLTPAGTIIKQTSKTATGSVAPTGLITKQAGKVTSGNVTSTGSINRQTGKITAGTVTPTGTLLRTLGKVFEGTVGSAGEIYKATSKAFESVLLPNGSMSTTISKIFGGTVASSGTLIRSVAKQFEGVVVSTGELVRTALKFLTGLINPNGSLGTSHTISISVPGVVTVELLDVYNIDIQPTPVFGATPSTDYYDLTVAQDSIFAVTIELDDM